MKFFNTAGPVNQPEYYRVDPLLARCPLNVNVPGSQRNLIMDRRGEGVPIIITESENLSGRKPEYRLLDDSELMLTIFSAKPQGKAHDEAQVEAHDLTETELNILSACLTKPCSTQELLDMLGYKSRTGNYKKAIKHLVDDLNLIERTEPKATRCKKQKYRITEKQETFRKKLNESATPEQITRFQDYISGNDILSKRYKEDGLNGLIAQSAFFDFVTEGACDG